MYFWLVTYRPSTAADVLTSLVRAGSVLVSMNVVDLVLILLSVSATLGDMYTCGNIDILLLPL